jgi:hypothetical protein
MRLKNPTYNVGPISGRSRAPATLESLEPYGGSGPLHWLVIRRREKGTRLIKNQTRPFSSPNRHRPERPMLRPRTTMCRSLPPIPSIQVDRTIDIACQSFQESGIHPWRPPGSFILFVGLPVLHELGCHWRTCPPISHNHPARRQRRVCLHRSMQACRPER